LKFAGGWGVLYLPVPLPPLTPCVHLWLQGTPTSNFTRQSSIRNDCKVHEGSVSVLFYLHRSVL
jgi:hypothetical protein